ncbi:hypothetical protein ACFFMN_22825 [Planobispora siamensis]|uniref:Uncharacterized protein n=1 Tax=Planobispora siamensis TaxID=936338 RepID=A0A8J3WQ26_9ACTN|nr:hypothetical protein [Planobispora siamensis]GIH95401.1 hypothetical protein Psi01_60310 [Planobispora siamensis]
MMRSLIRRLLAGAPMAHLARFSGHLARADTARFYWRPLLCARRWSLFIIWRAHPADPPEPLPPTVRINPDWLAKTGRDLPADTLLYLRIRDRIRAHTQDQPGDLNAASAANIAVDAVTDFLAERGCTCPGAKGVRSGD